MPPQNKIIGALSSSATPATAYVTVSSPCVDVAGMVRDWWNRGWAKMVSFCDRVGGSATVVVAMAVANTKELLWSADRHRITWLQ